jgi:hypothetical protein
MSDFSDQIIPVTPITDPKEAEEITKKFNKLWWGLMKLCERKNSKSEGKE